MPAGAGSPYAAVAHAAAAYAAAAAAASAAVSDQGPKPIFHAFQWSCRFLTWPELYVEKGHCLPEAWGTWIRCMENGLWAEHAGVQYILQDLVYSIRPVQGEGGAGASAVAHGAAAAAAASAAEILTMQQRHRLTALA